MIPHDPFMQKKVVIKSNLGGCKESIPHFFTVPFIQYLLKQ